MKKIIKVAILFMACLWCAMDCCAQWTAQDSLNLKKILESSEEIELNKSAIQSIGTNFNQLPEQPIIYKDRFHFDTSLPDSPYPLGQEPLRKPGMSLMPYSGATKYNYDPIYKKRIEFTTDKKPFGKEIMFQESAGEIINKGSFNYSLDELFTKKFWDFRTRKNARKTLIALSLYSKPDEAKGRYEYYRLDEGDYAMNFVGSVEAQEKINTDLKEHEQLKKGLLYFKYTSEVKGDFTFYLPDMHNFKGTFIRNWNGYRLFYEGMELVVSFAQIGGRFYRLKLNLTQQFRSFYPSDEIEKVLFTTTALKISSGSDRR